MVQLKRSAPPIHLWPDPGSSPVRFQLPMKLEIEECSVAQQQHHPLIKRAKPSANFNELSILPGEFPVPPSQYNPLDEPSPLGLRLRKSPSLLDLIQMKISQSSGSFASLSAGNGNLQDKKTVQGSVASSSEKRKASNFTAVLLKIGNWQYVSRYESDLVAKCYFAKQKLVWEILEGGLKSKIEIQWADIMALKANCPEDGPGTLTLTLTRPPLFFKETNPQPRKHTLWQAAADFTDGQASTHRQHFLQCAPGVLNKHYEKLLQCDTRLSLLSQQSELVLVSPYFVDGGFVSEDVHEPKVLEVNGLETATRSCLLKIDEQNSPSSVSFEHLSPEAPSPSSVMDLSDNRGTGNHEEVLEAPWSWVQFKVPGIRPSMSMSDLVNHIGNHISERVASRNLPSSQEATECQETLENIAQILLGDTQLATASDEKLMSRVNSLCCLLQEPATSPNVTLQTETQNGGLPYGESKHYSESLQWNKVGNGFGVTEECSKEAHSSKQSPGMLRKDSFGDLLFNLPRIASLPRIGSLSKFLFDISEDSDNQMR